MPDSTRRKRICFVSSRSGFIQSEEHFLMDWANGRVIQTLINSSDFDFSVAFFADPIKKQSYDLSIQAPQIYPLPFPFSYLGSVRNLVSFVRILKQIERENDILVVQLPFIGFIALLFSKRPTVFHVCANVLTAASNPFKYKKFSSIISRSFAFGMHSIFRILFARRRNLLIVNGDELGNVYRSYNPRIVVSSSIKMEEYVKVNDVAAHGLTEDLKLLFIGRPSKEKGFPTLLQAFKSLIDQDVNVSLSLLGMDREQFETLSDTKLEPKHLVRMHFYGFIGWGDHFRSIVRSSHCLIVSSVSEGTPRVLIEARSQGCPVIATNVGGVSTSVTNGKDGLLIPALDPEALANAIQTLMNEDLRMKLAKNGLQTAKRYSLEYFILQFVTALKQIEQRNEK